MIDYGILFIIGTFILLGIYLLYPTIYKVKEPFVVNPVAEASAVGKVEGVESASELPTAPYGQHASNAPSSYRVYSTEPASRNRILELLEDLKAFLTFEGPNLQDKSDPQIQLPLSTARGDLRTLESQAEVIKRNPGIRSTINDENLSEIFSNLEFLRGQARNVLGRELYTGQYTEKIKDVKEFESIEGFLSQDKTQIYEIALPKPVVTPVVTPIVTPIVTPTPIDYNSNSVKLSDVLEAYSRAMSEKTRLKALNTSDPETAKRVENISKVTTYLNDIISKVNSGEMKESDIPVTKKQLEIYLKGGVTPQESNALSELGLSPGLANLFSSNPDKNNELMQKYTDKFLKGFSWNVDVGLKYTSDNEAMAGFNDNFSKSTDKSKNGLNITGFPTTDELNQALNDQYMESSSNPKPTPTDPYANDPRNEGRPVSTFDWKERSKFIETAIRKRNLNPNDFGIMPQGAEVSDDFNWKGYAKMICTRLGASYDTGLPEACGCPPMSWTGWR